MISTTFLENGNAITATDEGYVILWENPISTAFLDNPKKIIKSASKVIV
jgi:hypothetical protein